MHSRPSQAVPGQAPDTTGRTPGSDLWRARRSSQRALTNRGAARKLRQLRGAHSNLETESKAGERPAEARVRIALLQESVLAPRRAAAPEEQTPSSFCGARPTSGNVCVRAAGRAGIPAFLPGILRHFALRPEFGQIYKIHYRAQLRERKPNWTEKSVARQPTVELMQDGKGHICSSRSSSREAGANGCPTRIVF